MKKNLNRKGFTLIELLAVIVVLAIIMVIAIPSVLDATGSAKKKSFVIYGQRVLEKAAEYVSYKEIENDPIPSGSALSLSDIGLGSSTDYEVCVDYTVDRATAKTTLTLHMRDKAKTYCFVDATTANIGEGILATTGCDSAKVTKGTSGCE